ESISRALHEAEQLIFVITRDWNSVDGQLQLYERRKPQTPWQAVGMSVPIVLGPNGLAWGNGLHGAPSAIAAHGEPIKREGDGKAPAGVFGLSRAFGYASPDAIGILKLPYLQAAADLFCVDDPNSSHYNQLVDQRTVTVDWNSAEEMRRQDDLYKWGVT